MPKFISDADMIKLEGENIPQKWIVGLTSYYQVKYFSTITITESNLNDRKRFYFAGGGQWFVDYVEFRKVN